MTPIYFPFTYLPQPVLNRLNTLFPKIVVFQPSIHRVPKALSAWHEKGHVDIRLPDASKDKALERLLKEYDHWAHIHSKESLNAVQCSLSKTPFFDDASSFQIRSEIKKAMAPSGHKAAGEPDTLLTALAFLALSQEFDRQQCELLDEMNHLDQMKNSLFDTLRGNPPESIGQETATPPSGLDPLANHMPKERINAWIQLFLHQLLTAPSTPALTQDTMLLVTSGRPVMDCIIERVPDIERVFCVERIPLKGQPPVSNTAFFNRIQEILLRLATDSQPAQPEIIAHPDGAEGHKNTGILSVYRITDISPVAFLNGYAGDSVSEEKIPSSPPGHHTLVGVIEDQETAPPAPSYRS